MTSGETTIYRVKTPFQEIELTRIDEDGEIALYLDGAIQFVSGYDDAIYHGVLASIPAGMLHGRKGKALILGGGDGLAARNLLSFPNILEIRMVEIDPGMIEFSSKHPIMRRLNKDAFRDPRLKVTVDDARRWVKESMEGGFSLGVIDFPDPIRDDLEDLFEAPFYVHVSKRMEPMRPIYSVQSSGAFSDVEEKVRRGLAMATRSKTYPVRFRGAWMADGSIVYGGLGVDPSMAKLHENFRAVESLSLSSISVF